MIRELELKRKSKSTKLTSFEQRALDDVNKTQVCVSQFFITVKKKTTSAQAQTTAASVVARASSRLFDLESSAALVAAETKKDDSINVSNATLKMRVVTCEGIFLDYNKNEMQHALSACALHASISINSLHGATFIGKRKLAQLVHKDCKGSKGALSKTTHGSIYSCDCCGELR